MSAATIDLADQLHNTILSMLLADLKTEADPKRRDRLYAMGLRYKPTRQPAASPENQDAPVAPATLPSPPAQSSPEADSDEATDSFPELPASSLTPMTDDEYRQLADRIGHSEAARRRIIRLNLVNDYLHHKLRNTT